MIHGPLLAVASLAAMFFVIALAADDGMLTPMQMMEQHKIEVGFPLFANGAIWGNLILISPALYVMGKYANQLDKTEMIIGFVLGLIGSYLLFEFVYVWGKFPDALAGPRNGQRDITTAGWVMMIYMAAVFAIIGLFYLATSVQVADALIVGGLLMLYIPVANHAVLGWLNSIFAFPWCPRIFAEESAPMKFIIGGEIAVFIATAMKTKFWQLF